MVAEVLEPLRTRGIDVPDLYLAIGNSPNILKGWIGLTSRLRYDSACPRNYIELAIMRVARLRDASYEWAHHWPMAIRHDLTPDQLGAIDQWPSNPLFSAEQQLVLAYVDAIVAHGVNDGHFEKLRSFLSERELVELTLTACVYVGLAHFVEAIQLDVETDFLQYLGLGGTPIAEAPTTDFTSPR
jgi:alkylhydroperoxidase family enzyme